MGRSRWLGHPLTLVVAGSVALAAGAAIAVAAVGVVDPVPGGGGTTVSYPVRQLMIVGRVSAVSRGSITLAAHGQRITAAITRSTRVTGRGRSVAAIRVGDTVSARIDQAGSPTVLAIQDPVSIP
jgi:hypothetical protein